MNQTDADGQDDPTFPSWMLSLNCTGGGNDALLFYRKPAGGTSWPTLLKISSNGSLTSQTTDGANNTFSLVAFIGSSNYGGTILPQVARGTAAAPTPMQTSDIIYQYGAAGQYSTTPGQTGQQGFLRFVAVENWTATARGLNAVIYTTPVGSNSPSQSFTFDNGGNYFITGSVGQKSTGTTWANPSDPRLKDDVTDYKAGLVEIMQLNPITYRLKANPDGPLNYGFDASAVREVFPECVTTTRMKLPGDEEETDDVLVFDMHPILVALVNAVKELASGRS